MVYKVPNIMLWVYVMCAQEEVAYNVCEQQRQQAVKTILCSCDNTNIII